MNDQPSLDDSLANLWAKYGRMGEMENFKTDAKTLIAHAMKQIIEPEEPVNIMIKAEHAAQLERLAEWLGQKQA